MPLSLSYSLLHIIFSTKGREPMIPEELLPKLHAYMATVSRSLECECYQVGGISDHVHLAIRIHRTVTISHLVKKLKTTSTHWMKREHQVNNFSWQRGYGAFSLSPKDLPTLRRHILNQATHHRKRDYQEELLEFLHKYGLDYDEQYLWD